VVGDIASQGTPPLKNMKDRVEKKISWREEGGEGTTVCWCARVFLTDQNQFFERSGTTTRTKRVIPSAEKMYYSHNRKQDLRPLIYIKTKN